MFRLPVLVFVLLVSSACQRAKSPEPKPVEQRDTPEHQEVLVETTGLYETAHAESRLCIVGSRFGLVVQAEGSANCGGSGRAARQGDGVRFTLEGDSACSFIAQVSGRGLQFPATVPAGCGYYCSTGATLAGVRLEQIAAGRNEAMKAKDLAGDPLCEGE